MAIIDQSWRNLCDARTSSDGNFYCSGSPNSKLDRRDFIIEPHSTWADIDDQSHWSGFPGNNLALPAFLDADSSKLAAHFCARSTELRTANSDQ